MIQRKYTSGATGSAYYREHIFEIYSSCPTYEEWLKGFGGTIEFDGNSWVIKFENDEDATVFALRFGK